MPSFASWIGIFKESHAQWTIVSILAVVFLANWLRGRMGWLAALAFGYLSLNAIYIWLWKYGIYYKITYAMPHDAQAIKLYAADSIAKLWLLLLPMAAIDHWKLRWWGLRACWLYCLIDLASIAIEWASLGCEVHNSCGGLAGNPSMGASLRAIMLPFLPWWLAAPVAASIVHSGSSVGLGLMAVAIGLWALKKRPWLLLAAPLPLVAGVWVVGLERFMSTSDRWLVWSTFMRSWNKPMFWPFGTGYGTFGVFSSLMNQENRVSIRWWHRMHNDWLELLFVAGVVGLVLVGACYLQMLWRSRRDWQLFSGLVLSGICMSMNFPAHMAYSCALLSWVAVLGLQKRSLLYLSGGPK